MIERDELAAWLRLLETPKLGRESVRKLLTTFGSPQAAVAAGAGAWREVAGANAATALATPPPSLGALLERTLAWLADRSAESHDLIPLGNPCYPSALLESPDPPLMLYCAGRCELLQAMSIAVVGSRNPTRQGSDNAREFSGQLSRARLTIVSGLALGVDGAAHEGGLGGAGSTVAVVGTGLDDTYPKRHRELAGRIAAQGLIVSEYALGTPPLALHFPARNRIIAGLTRGTLVVEANLRSGSLITARLASEAGREVFAIPGSIHSPQSRGCHHLIKQGAKLVEGAADVLEEFQLPVAVALTTPSTPGAKAQATTATDPLLDALGFDPMSLDALVARTGWSAARLNTRLLELELAGEVARLPGQQFQRIAHA